MAGAAAASGTGGTFAWVAETTAGVASGATVGETDSVNPPQARIGRINKIKNRFMLRRFVADIGGFCVYNFILRGDIHIAREFLHVFCHHGGRAEFGEDVGT